ncbi:hypothetical protein SNOG_06391 [Parastagonospora nodorum SN15]|uniref:Uncharacterized protein n=1 Tax=Phaeosphaeria nodorum (strain SN15 / ATCC MYA-4574 / FGSC 10173) TaxID=321614 RepID=Q0UPC3_PHANO|nr:hypothetical protein SNOG_06391 [Parastagonospora nodorum SN15]EAT86222.1 hypothetical protein SNOG_06391 [Parastagonospora nodorum SN15]
MAEEVWIHAENQCFLCDCDLRAVVWDCGKAAQCRRFKVMDNVTRRNRVSEPDLAGFELRCAFKKA